MLREMVLVVSRCGPTTGGSASVEERGLVGLEARGADGTEIGRISEVIADEESGEVTHVLVELEKGEELEVPISALMLDPEADFATFQADPSDDEPGDHLADEERPQGYEHEGQFVTAPQDPAEARSPDELEREAAEAGGWEDEASTPESGYPRNDVYIDPDTGEEELDPSLVDSVTLEDDVEDLIGDTGMEVRAVKDGVVELTGAAATHEDLEEMMQDRKSTRLNSSHAN